MRQGGGKEKVTDPSPSRQPIHLRTRKTPCKVQIASRFANTGEFCPG